MKVKLAFVLSILLWVNYFYVDAQNNAITFNLVQSNGIEPLGNITGITQDTKGFMWFSGQGAACLYRYDGYRMLKFTHDSLDINTPGGTNFETVYADDSGKIWIGFLGAGMDEYDPGTGKFKHFGHLANDPSSISNDSVSVITRDQHGIVWAGTQNGLNRLDEKTGKFSHYYKEEQDPFSLSSNVIRALYVDKKGVLWIGTGFPFDKNNPEDGGLNKMIGEGKFIRYLHDPKNPNSLINNKVRSIFEDSRGNFWIGTGLDGLHTMNREKGSFERHLYDASKPGQLSGPAIKEGAWWDHITFINEDGAGAIWIGTFSSGINRYDAFTKKITHFESSNGFPDRSGWMSYTSKDGVLWLSSTENEPNLYRVNPFLKNIPGVEIGYAVRSILEDSLGFFWIGTRGGGLFKLSKDKKIIHHYVHDPIIKLNLQSASINSILENTPDTLWISTADGIYFLNKVTGHFTRIKYELPSTSDMSYESLKIIEDKKGAKWFATLGGLIEYNSHNGSIKQFRPNPIDSASISSYKITDVLQDRHGDIWASAWLSGGVNRLNTQTGRFTHYLKGFSVGCLYEDSKGVVWAGSNNGLFYYNKNTDSYSSFFDSLSVIKHISGITEDDSKNLWLSTQIGIVKIDSSRKESFIYGNKFGVTPNSLQYRSTYKARNGEILIGSNNGFYAFYPQEIHLKIQPFNINITSFFINNDSVLHGSENNFKIPFQDINEIELEYNQDNFSFDFAASDYRAPEDNEYFSMLEGYDNTWHNTSDEKRASYFNVPPGDYLLHLKIFTSEGIKAERLITIIIHPPWWKTWWAYSLYFLLLIITVIIIFRYQKQHIIRVEKQKNQLKEIAHAKEIEKAYTELKSTQAQLIQSEKMASLGELTAGIAHEIQNPLNFVNNFSDVNRELLVELKDEADKGNIDEVKAIANDVIANEEKINHHGKRADAIVKGMLQHSRQTSGVKEPTDINALCDEYLRLAYHGLRAKDKEFNTTMKTDFDESIGKINIIPQDIGRVLLNLFNNAFYAVKPPNPIKGEQYEPTIMVGTKKINNKVEIRVADNGNGIPQKIVDKIFQPFFTTKPTGQGTGLGLSLSYDIVKAHGGEIKVETKEGEGTTFIIQIPANN